MRAHVGLVQGCEPVGSPHGVERAGQFYVQVKMEGFTLEELVAFYDARDLFLGLGPVGCQNETYRIKKGFRRLSKSRVPEAVHVCSLFTECEPPTTAYWVRQVLGTKCPGDVIALCYSGIVQGYNSNMLEQAAARGNVLAMALVSSTRLNEPKYMDLAKKAAAAGERIAWNSLGLHFYGIDRKQSLVAFEQAAKLGGTSGMWTYGQECFTKLQSERYYWMGKACRATTEWGVYLVEARQHYSAREPNKEVMLVIGRMIKNSLAAVHRPQIDIAMAVAELYMRCIKRARNAVLCWLLCARRLHLYKDVSQLVAHLVWNERHAFLTFE